MNTLCFNKRVLIISLLFTKSSHNWFSFIRRTCIAWHSIKYIRKSCQKHLTRHLRWHKVSHWWVLLFAQMSSLPSQTKLYSSVLPRIHWHVIFILYLSSVARDIQMYLLSYDWDARGSHLLIYLFPTVCKVGPWAVHCNWTSATCNRFGWSSTFLFVSDAATFNSH